MGIVCTHPSAALPPGIFFSSSAEICDHQRRYQRGITECGIHIRKCRQALGGAFVGIFLLLLSWWPSLPVAPERQSRHWVNQVLQSQQWRGATIAPGVHVATLRDAHRVFRAAIHTGDVALFLWAGEAGQSFCLP